MLIDSVDGVCTVRPCGELDLAAAAKWRSALRAAATSESATIIDLAGVTFMDSAGLGVLIGGLGRMRDAGVAVALVCPPGQSRRTLHTSGLDRVVAVHEDRLGALAQLGSNTVG